MKTAILLFVLQCTCILAVAQLSGKVVSITDGDTVIVLDSLNMQHRIRLAGVDCPEKSQDFGQVARNFTAQFCYQKNVKVIIQSTDRYGREIGTLIVNKTDSLNAELLKSGLAWHYKQYDHTPAFARYENKARQAKRGLWKDQNPIAPWNFRKDKKN